MAQQRLFSTNKVPVNLDTYSPSLEKRHGEEVSVLVLSLRVQPFDSKLAVSLDAGIGSGNIRSTVFSLNSGEPKKFFTRHDFHFELPRQDLVIYATSDTDASRLAISQAKISGTCVRVKDDVFALCFKAAFGPVSRDELEFVHAWCHGQRAVTFEASEPSMEFEEEPADEPVAVAFRETPH